jgi:hypothetical protein
MKKDKKDKFEMGMKQANLSNSNFDRSSSAIRDTKMSSLLEKVRQSPKRKKNKKVISLNSKDVSKLDTLENKVNKKLRFGVKERYVPRPSNIFNIGLNENLTKIL